VWGIFTQKTALYPIRFESSAAPLWEPKSRNVVKRLQFVLCSLVLWHQLVWWVFANFLERKCLYILQGRNSTLKAVTVVPQNDVIHILD
jgi:hypothetical protein